MSELDPSEVVEVLNTNAKIEKRAQWEGFEFTLLGDNSVKIVNGSHDSPKDHSYTVHVEGNIPSDCTCPAWEYQEGACKHMVAVAIREPVIEAVSVESSIRADGGVAVAEDSTDDSDETECGCENLSDDFPCWPCVKDGRKTLPDSEK